MFRVGTGCSGYKIFGPPNQSGKIFGRSVEFGWSSVVINKSKLCEKQGKWVDYAVTYLLEDNYIGINWPISVFDTRY